MAGTFVRRLIASSGGVRASRAGTAVALAFCTAAAPSHAAPRDPLRLCLMAGDWGIWVLIPLDSVSGNYDPLTHTGVIGFNAMGGQNPDDVFMTGIPGSDGLPFDLTGQADMAMGTFEVVGGLGSSTCEVSIPSFWVTGSVLGVPFGFHYLSEVTGSISAALSLTGFTGGGYGVYEAHGLSIPVAFEVLRPDGTTVVVTRVCETIELRTPLDLTPDCPADCDGNGSLNIDDIDCFISAFLGNCS